MRGESGGAVEFQEAEKRLRRSGCENMQRFLIKRAYALCFATELGIEITLYMRDLDYGSNEIKLL